MKDDVSTISIPLSLSVFRNKITGLKKIQIEGDIPEYTDQEADHLNMDKDAYLFIVVAHSALFAMIKDIPKENLNRYTNALSEIGKIFDTEAISSVSIDCKIAP